jgi:hypothetical protein
MAARATSPVVGPQRVPRGTLGAMGKGGALLALLLVAAFAGRTEAQEHRGRVQGQVTDSSQAIVPGASVALMNNDTGVQNVRVTNGEGRFLFDYVDSGAYTLNVSLPGGGASRGRRPRRGESRPARPQRLHLLQRFPRDGCRPEPPSTIEPT